MRSLPTASSWSRAAHCHASASYPQVNRSSEAAERGTEIHELLRVCVPYRLAKDDKGFAAAYERALEHVAVEWRQTCNAIEWRTLLEDINGPAECEGAYKLGLNPVAVTFLGYDIGRNYGERTEWETATSIDLEAWHKDGSPIVADYKTGLNVGPVYESWQMRIQAFVRCIKTNQPGCYARLVYIAENGVVTYDETYFSIIELEGWMEELRDHAARIHATQGIIESGTIPDVHEGDWCLYCPSAHVCPAKTALIKTAVLDMSAIDAALASMTNEQAGFALSKVKEIVKLGTDLEKKLKDRVREEGAVPADAGYEWRCSVQKKAGMDLSLVRGKIYQLGGNDLDIESLSKVTEFPVIRRTKIAVIKEPKEKKIK